MIEEKKEQLSQEKIDILSMVLQPFTQEVKETIIRNKEITTDDNFHLLTLSCWCFNLDIIKFLIQDTKYLISALENTDFYSQFEELEKFNSSTYYTINNIFNSLLLEEELLLNLPINDIDSKNTKY